MKYKNILFDLYGTLVDIHTDEESENIWKRCVCFMDIIRYIIRQGKCGILLKNW